MLRLRRRSLQVALAKLGRPALVHFDDVASDLRCAVKSPPCFLALASLFLALADQSKNMQSVLDTLATNAGYKGSIEFGGSGGDAFTGATRTWESENAAGLVSQAFWGRRQCRAVFRASCEMICLSCNLL